MHEFSILHSSMTVRTGNGTVTLDDRHQRGWTIDLVDTGQDAATGGRIKRLKDPMGVGTSMLTWGDGVSDIDLDALLRFHRSHGRLATLTAARPPGPIRTSRVRRRPGAPAHRGAPDQRGLVQRRLLRSGAAGL
jgi:glucose-1-phosphate cytidylyltransferase